MGQQTEGTTAQLSSGARVDVLATIRAHAESHRSRAESDAFSAQEAPRLEAALAAVAELAKVATRALPFLQDEADKYDDDGSNEPLETLRDLRAALARMEPQS